MRKSSILYYSLHSPRRHNRQLVIEGALRELKGAFFRDAPISKLPGEQDDCFDRRVKIARSIGNLVADIEMLPEISVDSVLGLESFLIKYNGRLSELCIVLDYLSFVGNTPFECEQNASKVRSLIIEYPEVNFSFDETIPKSTESCGISCKDFLFFRGKEGDLDEREKRVKNSLVEDLHSFTISDLESYSENNSFIRLCYYYDNLFDPSNIRNAIKVRKYIDLNVAKLNYEQKQKCREKNLALCVEEERSQSLFNCYSAFANGYRCLPVVTALGLKWVNILLNNKTPQLILRDYDLQFPDEVGSGEIDKIRGWHFDGSNNRWTDTYDDNNEYWKSFIQSKVSSQEICYISKGDHNIKIKSHPYLPHQVGIIERDRQSGRELLVLSGLYKPISGVYTQIQGVESVGQCYVLSESDKGEFNKKRKDGIHGVPLDIYYMVKRMLDRARKYYYKEKRFVHAAVLAQEVLEVLNGFHEAMMMEAYHLVAVSENAIAMNTIGGGEKELKTDSEFRVKKICRDVMRMTKLEGNQRQELSYNVLSQIFVDCRDFCREKEHFEAEESFISAMAYLNSGGGFGAFKLPIEDIMRSAKLAVSSYVSRKVEAEKDSFKKTILSIAECVWQEIDNNECNRAEVKEKLKTLFCKYERIANEKWKEVIINEDSPFVLAQKGVSGNTKWSISNASVGSVDVNGLFSPRENGTAIVFAETNDFMKCFPIRVNIYDRNDEKDQ